MPFIQFPNNQNMSIPLKQHTIAWMKAGNIFDPKKHIDYDGHTLSQINFCCNLGVFRVKLLYQLTFYKSGLLGVGDYSVVGQTKQREKSLTVTFSTIFVAFIICFVPWCDHVNSLPFTIFLAFKYLRQRYFFAGASSPSLTQYLPPLTSLPLSGFLEECKNCSISWFLAKHWGRIF